MKLRIVLILALVALAAVAAFFLWPRSKAVVGEPTSPVLVDILLPQNGDSINQGDTISVLVQAWSPSPLAALQLWVDGELAAVTNVDTDTMPLKISWDWEASGPGVHTLFVKAGDTEGNEGQSESLIVNVNAGGFSQVSATGGQSLADIGNQTGLPISEISDLNPNIDPQQPLQDGQPVILPPNPVTGEGRPGGAASGPELVILWQFTPLEPVDKSYCYESLGGDIWQKIPADPFSFFPGDEWLDVPPNPINPGSVELMMECWGWQAGTLKYLGEGQTNLDYAQIPDALVIAGAGFHMDGLPEQKPLGGGGLPPEEPLQVPPPFALREAATVNECASHYGTNFWANSICDGLMNAQIKEYYTLVWEWQPEFCWGDCSWANEIDGFLIFELNQLAHSEALLKKIPNSGQKATAVPLPWGARCYGVRAYVETLDQGDIFSPLSTYCPGDPPEPETLVLAPQDWLSTEGIWINEGCGSWADAFRLKPSGTQLVVGSFLFIYEDDDCDIKQGSASAAVKFPIMDLGIALPQGAVIQRAVLHLKQVDVKYDVPSDVAVGFNPSLCATQLRKGSKDWTGLSDGHFKSGDVLYGYSSSYKSGFTWAEGGFSTDVTSVVLNWIEHPSTNHGFIFIASEADLENQYIFEPGWDVAICYSLLDNVELDISYFAPN